METILRTECLFDGLTSDERRRLYFLLLVADKLHPREALAFAERMDEFISRKAVSSEPNSPPFASVNNPTGESSRTVQTNGSEPEFGNSGDESPAANNMAGTSRASANHPASFNGTPFSLRSLDSSTQIEFFKAVARGATNAELAERFGLTKRQAHTLRIGMMRRSRAGSSSKSRDHQLSAGGVLTPEGRHGSERQKALAAGEIEVVRFLRQTGDVVVKDGEVFAVNSILRLTLQELIARANARRLQRGKPTFDFPRVYAPDVASDAKANGATRDEC
jgi:hypothetical protein